MAEQLSTNEVRQGRNVRGMIWVLAIGIGLVVLAYMVMLAFSAEPVTVDGESASSPAAASDAAAPDASPAMETQ